MFYSCAFLFCSSLEFVLHLQTPLQNDFCENFLYLSLGFIQKKSIECKCKHKIHLIYLMHKNSTNLLNLLLSLNKTNSCLMILVIIKYNENLEVLVLLTIILCFTAMLYYLLYVKLNVAYLGACINLTAVSPRCL